MSETDNTAVQEVPQAIGDLTLATLNPAQYVEQAYASFESKLADAIAAADSVQIDCTTTAGMEIAVKHRAVFRDDFRLKIESTRKDIKAPILEIGTLIDSRAKDLTAKVLPYEERFDKAIKAEQARKAEEKRLREEAERAKVAAIMADIQQVRDIAATATGKSSAEILSALGLVEALAVTEQRFGAFTSQASVARAETIDRLQVMYRTALETEESARAAAEAAERERQRIAAEQEALARQRAEQERIAEQQRKEAERLATMQREQEEALRKAEEERQRMAAAEQEKLRREAEQLQREREAFAAEQARARAAAEAPAPASAAEPAPAPETEAQPVNTPAVADAVIEETGAQVAAQQAAEAPAMRLGQISERLGFAVTADFLSFLGFAPASTEKAAKLYHAREFPSICAALIRHIQAVSKA